MLQNEFEALLGHSVTPEVYNTANEMYMESPLNKQDFVKEYKKYHLAESEVVNGLIQSLRRERDEKCNLRFNLEDSTNALKAANYEIVEFLIQEDSLHSSDSLRNKAKQLIGDKDYIKKKIEMGYPLNEDDVKLIGKLLD